MKEKEEKMRSWGEKKGQKREGKAGKKYESVEKITGWGNNEMMERI